MVIDMAHFCGVRLADVLHALSLAVDLGLGQPMGHVVRSCLLAQEFGAKVGMPEHQREQLYFVTLMGWVGCIADSRQAAAWFGDDIDYRAGVYDLDMRPLPFLGYLLERTGAGKPPVRRAGRAAVLVATGARGVQDSLRAHCQVTEQVASRLGLPEPVCVALRQVFARWDDQGLPKRIRGDAIALTIRLWHIADVAEVHAARGGHAAAVDVLQARRGTQFDPDLVDLFCCNAEELLGSIADFEASWDDVVASHPGLTRHLPHEELDHCLEEVGDWVDLKSAYFTGHSRAVAELAAAAARERIRLHSYYTERMLAGSETLAAIGALTGATHERLDGSGYHRGRSAADLPLRARVLAAAECYRTSTEERPHRARAGPAAAATALRREAHDGRLDPLAVDAVLTAAGQRRGALPAGPAGLTVREVEVLALLAQGRTNRQVARTLGISPKAAGNHIEHIYTKAGVSTRAAATLFAMEHGLV
jgi:HD-GYP domain-containing protein (c-di-GMP phosphodiesterase class II)